MLEMGLDLHQFSDLGVVSERKELRHSKSLAPTSDSLITTFIEVV